jgi:hypothetical protein
LLCKQGVRDLWQDVRPWLASPQPPMLELGPVAWGNGGAVMKPSLLWIAVSLMLLGAGMLVAGIGAPALWIAVVTVGIALVVIGRVKSSAPGPR